MTHRIMESGTNGIQHCRCHPILRNVVANGSLRRLAEGIVCRPKLSGNTPHVLVALQRSKWTLSQGLLGMQRTRMGRRIPWLSFSQTHGDSTTCWAMRASGASPAMEDLSCAVDRFERK